MASTKEGGRLQGKKAIITGAAGWVVKALLIVVVVSGNQALEFPCEFQGLLLLFFYGCDSCDNGLLVVRALVSNPIFFFNLSAMHQYHAFDILVF